MLSENDDLVLIEPFTESSDQLRHLTCRIRKSERNQPTDRATCSAASTKKKHDKFQMENKYFYFKVQQEYNWKHNHQARCSKIDRVQHCCRTEVQAL